MGIWRSYRGLVTPCRYQFVDRATHACGVARVAPVLQRGPMERKAGYIKLPSNPSTLARRLELRTGRSGRTVKARR